MKQCKTCGYSTAAVEIFRDQKNIWGRSHSYCVVCADSKESEIFKQKMIFSFCITLIVFLFILYSIFKSIWFPLSLGLIPAFYSLGVFFHEIGHALVARLLGLKVHFVVIGSGKPLFKLKLGGIEFDFRVLPFSGYTLPAFTRIKGVRYKQFLISIAGPFMNLVLASLPFLFEVRDYIWWISFWNPYFPVQMFILVNLYLFIIGMWPRIHNTPLGKMPSDGKNILNLPTVNQATIEGWLAANYSMEAQQLRKDEYYDEAERVVREGLEEFPNNPINLNDLALVYLETSRYHEALTILHDLIKREDIDPCFINIIASNISWIDLLIDDPELFDEADRLSEQAYRFLPRVPSIISTRGWILIKREQVEDGIFLLKTAFDRYYEPQDKALVACCLAMGEAKLGYLERAKIYLHLAKKMDTACLLLTDLPRLAPELAGAL